MARSFSVLVLDGGDYGLLKVLRCLGQSGDVTSHILSRDKKPTAGYSRYCKKYHYNSSRNDNEWIEVIKDIVREHKIDVLLPTTTASIEFASRNYKALSEITHVPPTPEYELLKMAQDKWSFHCFVIEHGLPASPTILFADQTNKVSGTEALDSIEFPVLLKPTQEMGGSGIIKIDKRSDFCSIIEQKKALQPDKRYIVQSYIPGEDLCLGVCCKEGKILSYVLQKDLSLQNNSFGHQKVMEYIHNDMAIEIGSRLVSSMAWDGMAFIDLRIDSRDNTTKLLEVNPRLGRAFLGALAAGVNFPLNLCYSALGIDITDKQREFVRYAHPSAYIRNLMSRIKGKKVPVKLRWRESGLRYSVADPLPELFEIIHKTANIKLFRTLFNGKRRIAGNQA
jgi:predicted ATP-grasp superfamily ATP-dependent carboligase